MTSARRLAKLETSLTPTQLVLRWLAEAHTYGSLEAYVGSLLDLPGEQQPIDRLCRDANDGARARLRRKPPEEVRKAVNSALRETVFRFELALRIYVTTRELLDREALIDAALIAHVALATSEEAADTDHLARRVTSWSAGSASYTRCRKLARPSSNGTSMVMPPFSLTWRQPGRSRSRAQR